MLWPEGKPNGWKLLKRCTYHMSCAPPPPLQVMRETNNNAYVEDTKMIEVIKSTEGRKTHKENKMQGG